MLDGYFGNTVSTKDRQRLLAVQAALEIVKASAGSGGVMHSNLDQATDRIEKLADAIQAALKK
ncbi:hypothetical protein [Escherichia coli]|uniref:hypothetical protein n=1 Tax=Escherichia coli TaxID=562 RepID=UPI0007C23AA4|nr:hypothetical protein [Escherichia coli]MCV5652031.1 hypothetical protein [Escherichia coli]OAC24270.1 hypothetical protein EC2772a_37c00090 [Escherichia coli]OKU37718.1 hypothetical protein ACN83_22690 [Escherichia coli]HAW1622719.1 hypothetical protein [Escherichia coli]HEB5736882.1 hypothetical protein [Escherichia coli]